MKPKYKKKSPNKKKVVPAKKVSRIQSEADAGDMSHYDPTGGVKPIKMSSVKKAAGMMFK